VWIQHCQLCGRQATEALCLACWQQITPLADSDSRCLLSEAPVPQPHIAYGAYVPPLKQVLFQIKYHRARSLALALGAYLGQWYAQHWPLPDLLVPVPLHPTRQAERGYNQAELLARGMAQSLERPVCRALNRIRDTPALHTLSAPERQTQMQDVFALAPKPAKALQAQRILLVDDILTTGTTLLQAAKVLHTQSPKVISFSVVRRLRAESLD